MSNVNVGTVQIVLSAVDKRLQQVLRGSEKALGSFAKGVEGMAAKVNPFNALVGVVSVAALAAFVRKGFESVDAMAKQSDQLGITTQAYVGLKLASIESGGSMEETAKAIDHVNSMLLKAREGNEEAISAFAKLGLTAEQLAGVPADKKLGLIADKLNTVKDQGTKAAVAMGIFGEKAGSKLLIMLTGGSAGIADQTAKAEALGLAISRVDAKQVENANDRLTEVWEVIGGIANRIAVELSPYVTALADAFLGVAQETGGFRDVVHTAVDMAVKGAVLVYDFWLRLKEVWGVLKIGIISVVKGAIDALTYLVGYGENLRKQWTAGWHLFRDDVVLVWSAIKAKFTGALDFMAGGFADWLDKVGHSLNRIKDGLGDGLIETADKVKNATAKMAADADKDWTAASDAAFKSQNEFLTASKDVWKVNLDETGQHIGDFWADWRQNLSDNLGIEVSDLEKQGNERLTLLADLERKIVAAREKSRRDAEKQLKQQGVSGPDESEAEILRKQMEAREKLLGTAESDPRVKYEKEVLSKIGEQHDLAQARQIIDDKAKVDAYLGDPELDPKVAYQVKVDQIIAELHEQQERAEAQRRQRETEATISAYGTIASNLDQVTGAIAEQSLAGFRAHQATSIASAVINAWLAYSQALAAPDVPQYLKQAMAATALGAGLAAAGTIASQRPSGRATGGPVQSGGMYQVGENGRPELLSVGGKNYLIMGDRSGSVNPAGPGGGAPKVEVHVHTQPGTSARTESSQGADGSPRVDVIIEAVENRIAGGIAQGSSPVSKSMERTYGLNRSRGAVR